MKPILVSCAVAAFSICAEPWRATAAGRPASGESAGTARATSADELPMPREPEAAGEARDAPAAQPAAHAQDDEAAPQPQAAAASADEEGEDERPDAGFEGPPPREPASLAPESSSDRCGTLERPRCSLFWLPLASVLVPGLGQALDRRPAVPYFVAGGVGFGAGLWYMEQYLRAHPQNRQDLAFTPTNDMLLDGNGQAALFFSLLEQDAGFISAYDTYRHRLVDELGVATSHSSVPELLAAPLHLEKLLKPAVVLPLAVAAALTVLSVRQEIDDARKSGTRLRAFDGYRAGDALTTAALSYGAGTSEEAFFRGFMMSYLEHRWAWSPLVANGLQGVVFSLAHGVGDGAAGFGMRAALGWYLGWLAQRSDYDLTDGAFVHAWWDVIAFSAVYAIERPKLAAGGGRVMMLFPAMAF